MNYSKLRDKCFVITYEFVEYDVDYLTFDDIKHKRFKFKNSSQLQLFIKRILNNDDFIVLSVNVDIYCKDSFEHLPFPEHSKI